MSYAGNRVIYDADGHIMELPTHLREFADPDVRELIPLTSYSASSVTEEEVDVLVAQGGRHSDDHINRLLSLGDGLIAEIGRAHVRTPVTSQSRMPSSA